LAAGEQPEQGGLARPVAADHADDSAGRQLEREILEQEHVAVALREVVGLDHLLAEARPGRDRDLDGLRRAVLLLGAQLLVRSDARLRLRLARARRHLHPLELALQGALARGLLLLLELEALLLLLEPRGVVALVRDAAAAVELEDPAGDVVEEVA